MKKIFIISLFLVLGLSACSTSNTVTKAISLEEAKTQAVGFINDYLMNPGQEVTVKEITEENGLYKIVVNIPTTVQGKEDVQETTSYLSKDGKTFFPSGMNIDEFKKQRDEDKKTADSAVSTKIEKNDKPKVELFVMSYCPYGTQIEKGILPVLDTLGDKIDFELKFCDYAMHDKKELDENLSQYCISQNEPEKLATYLKCFLDSSKGDVCLSTAGINKSTHSTCVSTTDKKYKVTEMYNDKSTWRSGRFPAFNVDEADNKKYQVGGSPTLIINGAKAQSGRDSASLLKTICSAFNDEPAACQTKLSSDSPKPGFGSGTTNSGSSASCGG